jgi:hypothetical protein
VKTEVFFLPLNPNRCGNRGADTAQAILSSFSMNSMLRLVGLFAGLAWVPLSAVEPNPDAAPHAADLDALYARCTKILTYGDPMGLTKPGKVDAVIALGMLGDDRAVQLLIDHLQNGTNPVLRAQIIRVLGWIKSPSSVPVLEEAVKDQDWHIRREAVRVLKEITGKDYPYDRTEENKRMSEFRQRFQLGQELPPTPTGEGAPPPLPQAPGPVGEGAAKK